MKRLLDSSDSSDSSVLGNTKPTRIRSRKWVFTLNNPLDDTVTHLTQEFAKFNVKYIFSLEKGEKGTPHLQGYLEFPNQVSFYTVQDICPGWHLEKARGTPEQNIAYCSKESTHLAGPWIKGLFVPPPLKILKREELSLWQAEIESMLLQEPDGRTIYWLFEPLGKFGKTDFIKYMVFTYPQVQFCTAFKSADLVTIASKEKTIYLFDVPRVVEGFLPWTGIEQLKNGLLSDGKLKKQVINLLMNPPQIAFFANWLPPGDKLSADRLKIINLRDLQDEIETLKFYQG